MLRRLLQALGGSRPANRDSGDERPVPAETASEPNARIERVRAMVDAGDFAGALALAAEMLDEGDDPVLALAIRGNVQTLSGDRRAAVATYLEAIEMSPGDPGLWMNLGSCHTADGNRSEAARCYRQVVSLDPRFPGALAAYAAAVPDKPVPVDDRAFLEDLVRREPGLAEAHAALGTLYMRGSMESVQALAALDEARRLGHRLPELFATRGVALQELGRIDEAKASFDEALAIDPSDRPARFHRSLLLLLDERFEEAWSDYELRLLSTDRPHRDFGVPRWNGEPLDGKRVLVYGEQGIGDEIMFASCIAELEARGARCFIDCAPKLERLYARSFPRAQVRGATQYDPIDWAKAHGFDYAMPVGSLPAFFRRSRADFPREQAYLKAEPDKVAAYRERLRALGPEPTVALSWRGGVDRTRRNTRSIPLELLAPLLAIPGVRFVNLQYDADPEELEAIDRMTRLPIARFPEALPDYDDTAALVMACAEVVSVTTALVHLSGALGRSALVLAPFTPEWRYGRSGERMLWFPSIRLMRQASYGDWSRPLAQAEAALRERLAGPRGQG